MTLLCYIFFNFVSIPIIIIINTHLIQITKYLLYVCTEIIKTDLMKFIPQIIFQSVLKSGKSEIIISDIVGLFIIIYMFIIIIIVEGLD